MAPIKKSRFIVCIYKVANHIELLNSLDSIKNSYHNAKNYCWSYSLSDNN
ncbi:YigZ family protein, partial [Francisella tularensis subsp. holarctica]|nr:YigZ family protein [Francisella tularensis subsp. holarctica]